MANRVYFDCNFFKPGDPGAPPGLSQDQIDQQNAIDCPEPPFTSIGTLESEFLEVITERLIPVHLKEKYPNFKQFIFDLLKKDRKDGIYNKINKFPDLINVKTTEKALLPKFVLQYLNGLPAQFLPISACEFRKDMELFKNFLPGTVGAIQQLLLLLGINLTRILKFVKFNKLRILTEDKNALTPVRQGGWLGTPSQLATIKQQEIAASGEEHFNPIPIVQWQLNDPIWHLDGESFIGEEYILNDIGEKIYFNFEKLPMPISDLIKKSIEIPTQFPNSFWAELVQNYGFFADGFVFGKFIMSLWGLFTDENAATLDYPIRKIEMNSEFMYPWRFNRIPKEWIPGGFWDYSHRQWLDRNKTDLMGIPTDPTQTRLGRSANEVHDSNNKKSLPEIETELFKWGRTEKNSWKLRNDNIGTFIFDEDHNRVLVGGEPVYADEDSLANNVFETLFKVIQLFHWVLTDFLLKIKIDIPDFNYNTPVTFLETDYWDNLAQQQLLSFPQYCNFVAADPRINLFLDGSWTVSDFFGFLLRRKFLLKKYIEEGYGTNGLINMSLDHLLTKLYLLNQDKENPSAIPGHVFIGNNTAPYFGIDKWRRLPREEEMATTLFHINTSTLNANYVKITNEANGMYLSTSFIQRVGP